jgi:Kef-type K+ transport system membrane component KefB
MAGTKALPQQALIAFYCSLALLMIFARGLGELARMMKQPAILGEVCLFLFIQKMVEELTWHI